MMDEGGRVAETRHSEQKGNEKTLQQEEEHEVPCMHDSPSDYGASVHSSALQCRCLLCTDHACSAFQALLPPVHPLLQLTGTSRYIFFLPLLS